VNFFKGMTAPFSYLVDNKAEREENHLVDLAVADSAGTHDGQGVLSVARRTDEKRSLRFSGKEIFGGVASDGLFANGTKLLSFATDVEAK
jgi:hypothetical protein